MLTLVVPPAQLGAALATGVVSARVPRTVQVSLVGRPRPFVCARDVALELLRRGVGEVVRRVEKRFGAPVVLELTGPGVHALSVGARAVLASLAPTLGAVAAVCPSDERTKVFLRDERRSKAYRPLASDPGAPCDEVTTVDLAGVDPLVLGSDGAVRAVRDLGGTPAGQVVLGGDSGTTLRDLLGVAALLKSKRVCASVDFLLAVPTRQMLEVLSTDGALASMVATGARIVEPDVGIATGEIYPPPRALASLRSHDPGGGVCGSSVFVASAQTLAYAAWSGEIRDPRAFKRPARVTVPRALPTGDVLFLRPGRAAGPTTPITRTGSARPLARGVSRR